MDLERERGITTKLTTELNYTAKDGETYIFHRLTPQDTWITYEVSLFKLAACEGPLVVDAAQGIEAQTLANVCLAWITIWKLRQHQ